MMGMVKVMMIDDKDSEAGAGGVRVGGGRVGSGGGDG